MNKLFLILFPLVITFDQNNDWDKDNLKGKVKCITEISYVGEDRFGDIVKVRRKRLSFIKYNSKGFLTERLYFNKDSILSTKQYFIRAEGDFLKELNSYEFRSNTDSVISVKWIFKYDDKGNLTTKKSYNYKGELSSTNEYKYDINGNISKMHEYDRNKLGVIASYLTDGSGKVLEREWKLIGDYPSITTSKFEYNNLNDVVSETTYDINEPDIPYNLITYEYKYDSKGNWIESIVEQKLPNIYNLSIIERRIEYY